MLFYYFNGRNVARTCQHFRISRQTCYRWKRRFDRHDLTTLEGRSRRPQKVRQPTWSPGLAERVLALRKQYPRWGKDNLAVRLRREQPIVFDFHGRAHPDPTEAARGVARTVQVHAESDQAPALNFQLRHWEKTYNCIRPHQSLAYLTPLKPRIYYPLEAQSQKGKVSLIY
jgi:hypothetical protein